MGGQKDSQRRFRFDKLGIDIPLVYRSFDIPEGETSIIRMSGQRTRLGGPADAKNGLSHSEIPTGERIKAQDYLIKGRNPLLIIYFIHIDNSDQSEEDIHTSISDTKEEKRVKRELQSRTFGYLVGYAIGFPNKDGATGENITYTVNKTVNYFEKEHEDEGDEGNE